MKTIAQNIYIIAIKACKIIRNYMNIIHSQLESYMKRALKAKRKIGENSIEKLKFLNCKHSSIHMNL